MKTYKLIVLSLSCFFLLTAVTAAENLRINMLLDDGRILIYKGKDSGFALGDALEVVRDGKVIATLQVLEQYERYSIAGIISKEHEVTVGDEVRKYTAQPYIISKPSILKQEETIKVEPVKTKDKGEVELAKPEKKTAVEPITTASEVTQKKQPKAITEKETKKETKPEKEEKKTEKPEKKEEV
ncbi:MAG: hypothetical protein AB1546_11160, partial [bacterium]